MKPLFVPIFAAFTVVVQADQHVSLPVRYSSVPMSEVVMIYEMPSYPVTSSIVTTIPERVYTDEHYTDWRVVSPTTYTVAKPTEKPLSLAPLLPVQGYTADKSSETIRGQAKTIDELSGFLDSAPSLPQGAAEEGMIDPKLTGISEPSESDSDLDLLAKNLEKSSSQTGVAGKEATSTDPLGYAVLLTATVITTIGLVYMAFVAYDYRQRWMQSLTVQNDRYLGGGAYDVEMEDTYGVYGGGSVSFPEGFGLSHPSI
jgi:multisubunit Na+/H+ antiporter MnhC subunit